MAKLLFIVVGILVLFVLNGRKKGYLTPSSLLISIYLISAISCVFYVLIYKEFRIYQDKYWPAAIVFLILITSYLFPYYRVNEAKWETIKLPSRKALDSFSNVLIVLSFFSMVYYVGDVISIFQSGDLSSIRHLLASEQMDYSKSGLLNTIASVSASFYDVVLLLFFIYNIIGCSKIKKTLLFLASFSYTIQALTYVGRDGVVFWLFSFIFDFLLFKDFINYDVVAHLKRTFIRIAIIVMIPFMAITMSRFGESDAGAVGGMISYMGQPIYHWCMYYGMDHRYRSPGASWPLFYEVTGIRQPGGAGMWEAEGTYSYSFGTFLRSWYNTMDMGGVIGILLFMWLVFALVFSKSKKKISFHQLFIYLIFFEVLSQGVFYFKFGNRGGNLSIVLMFFFYYFFRQVEASPRSTYCSKTTSHTTRTLMK